jgi:general secretion pathway protein A
MYLEHFKFDVEPFALAPDSNFLYLGTAHKKALNYLKYALWNRDSFTLISGAIGAGKTILLQCLLKTLPESILVVTINQTQLSPVELLEILVDKLGLTRPEYPTKPNLYKVLRTFLTNMEGQSVVFIIDEAQGLPLETIEELRLLATNDYDDGKINMNIIFCGQPELKKMIESPQLEQLNQRIRLKFELEGLIARETTDYIIHRLSKAGGSLDLFSKNALAKVYQYTRGVPRKINKLCDTALICAFAADLETITTKQIEEAAKELKWSLTKKRVIKAKKTAKTVNTAPKANEDNIIRLKPAISETAMVGKAMLQHMRNIDVHLSKIAMLMQVKADNKD